MPYEIKWDSHGAIRRFWGFVTSEDIRRSFNELHSHPSYNVLLCILHDHSEMTGRDWGKDDVTLLGANHLSASVGNPKLIDMVVTTDKDFIAFLEASAVAKLLPQPIQFVATLSEGRKRYDEVIASDINS